MIVGCLASVRNWLAICVTYQDALGIPRGDDEVRSGESDAVLAMIKARTEAPVDFTHERYQDCRDMLQGIRMATGRPGATASENNGEEITIPRDRAPLRLRHLGGRHG